MGTLIQKNENVFYCFKVKAACFVTFSSMEYTNDSSVQTSIA